MPSQKNILLREKNFSGVVRGVMKTSAGKRVERVLGAFANRLLCSSARAYGAMCLAFGLVMLIGGYGLHSILRSEEPALSLVIISIVLVVISVPLLLYTDPIYQVLQNFSVTDYLLFEFFYISRPTHLQGSRGIPVGVFAIFGAMLGVLGLAVPAHMVVIVLLVLLFTVISFASPEFPFICTVLMLPYISLLPYPSITYIALVVISALSFLRKTFLGKRIYHFGTYDILMLLMAVLTAVSVFITQDGSQMLSCLWYPITFLLFIPAGNISVNRRLCDRIMCAIVVCALPVAIFAIVELFFGVSVYDLITSNASTDAVSSTFSSNRTLALMLMVATASAFALASQDISRAKKTIYTMLAILYILVMLSSLDVYLYIALFVAITVSATLLAHRAVWRVMVSVVSFVWYLVFLLDGELLSHISEYLSLEPDLVSLRDSIISSLTNHSLFGNGVSTGTLASNIYFGILNSFGIVALSVFLLLIIFRLYHITAYRSYLNHSSSKVPAVFMTASMFGIIAYGFSDFLLSEISSLALFIVVFAIGGANIRLAKSEIDDRLDYYGDNSATDYSAVDIPLS